MLSSHARGLGDVYYYYPMLATIVTAKSVERSNAMAVAWHAIVSTHPPSYGVSISPKRFTHSLILDSGRFAVNFMPMSEAELVAAVGGCSGRDIDKFKAFGIKTVKSVALDVPILKNAYAVLECEVVSTLRCGDHDWFVGRVEASHHCGALFDKRGLMKVASAKPAAYMGEDSYLVMGGGRLRHFDRKESIRRRTVPSGRRKPRA